MVKVQIRLDATTPMGSIYFVEITDEAKGIRSIAAKVSGPCIAEEHGLATEEIAEVCAKAIREALAKVA